jgi:hypothetical protein
MTLRGTARQLNVTFTHFVSFLNVYKDVKVTISLLRLNKRRERLKEPYLLSILPKGSPPTKCI